MTASPKDKYGLVLSDMIFPPCCSGEGFPLWSAGMAAMYATEIVANHFLDGFISTFMMDMHADSLLSTQEVSADD